MVADDPLDIDPTIEQEAAKVVSKYTCHDQSMGAFYLHNLSPKQFYAELVAFATRLRQQAVAEERERIVVMCREYWPDRKKDEPFDDYVKRSLEFMVNQYDGG